MCRPFFLQSVSELTHLSRMKTIALLGSMFCLCNCSAEEKASGQEQERILAEKQKAYPALVKSIEETRMKFAERWAAADTTQQASILAEARAFIEKSIIEDLFPCWMGTPWDFNGVTQKPGEGAIACGYFVSTLLRDVGYRVERAKLGQQASQIIIRSMTTDDLIKITSNSSMKNMEEVFKNRGDGLYIVGLDSHAGFVTVKGDTLTFVHSSYYTPPHAVCAEPLQGKNPFADSAYRVIGKIPGDESVKRWIKGEKIEIRK